METVIASPVTNVMEVQSSNEDFNKREHTIISNETDISKSRSNAQTYTDNETYDRRNEEKVEDDLREVVYNDVSSNTGSTCHNNGKLQGKEAFNSAVKNNCLEDDNNFNKISEDNEAMADNELHLYESNIAQKVSKRLLNLIDSESEEEKINSHETSDKEYAPDDECLELFDSQVLRLKGTLMNKRIRKIVDSESEDDISINRTEDTSQIVNKSTDATTNNYQALIDSESEEDTVHNSTKCDNAGTSEIKNIKKKSVKKRKGSIRASKDKAMHQIHSETQRLLRETEISLPYHRPKQRTLQEFLSRNKLLAALPKAPSSAAKLKMSSMIVSQALAKKEKEAEHFYKSSDSEDDMKQSTSPACKNKRNCSTTNKKMPLVDSEYISVQDQNIQTNNQDFDNYKEIVSQDEELSPLVENNSNQDGEFKSEESREDLQKNSVVKRLFDTSLERGKKTDRVTAINHNQQETANTFITFLDKEKHVNDKELEINTIENNTDISKVHQYYSEINESDGSKDQTDTIETIKIPETFDASNKQTIFKMFKGDDVVNDVLPAESNDVIVQDSSNEIKNKSVETDDVSLSFVKNVLSKIQDNSLSKEDEELDGHVLGLPLPKFTDEPLSKKVNKKKSLSKVSVNSDVTLKGSPGMMIDLTGNAKSSGKGVNTLLDRFFGKHVVNTKKQTCDKSEVTVIHVQDTPNGPIPIKETLPYKLPINDDNFELDKPGAKLLRLKENLRLQMTLKRNREWKEKGVELQMEEKEGKEGSDCDLDESEEIDNLELSDSGESSEPEENDICIKDKKRRKCLYADDEAEVTDDEGSDISEDGTCNESDTDGMEHNSKQSISFKHKNKSKKEDIISTYDSASEIDINQEEEEEEENGDEEDLNVEVEEKITRDEKDRKTKQLMQEFQDDSYIINSKDSENKQNRSENITANVEEIYREDNDNRINEDENDISASQQHAEITTKSQMYKTPLKAKTSMLDFVSPITQLSILNVTLDSSNKQDMSENRGYLDDKHEFISIESTQNDKSPEYAYNIRNKIISQKKLFDDIEEAVDDEYLKQLCSGKFGSTPKTNVNSSSQVNSSKSYLLEVCSSNFDICSSDMKQLESSEIEDETSQDIRLTLDEDLSNNSIKEAKEINVPADSKKLIRIASSDDESQSDEDTFFKPKNRPVRRLNLSDSEEENAKSSNEEEENANSSDEESENINDKEEYIDYDSEENEVVVVPKKDIKKVAADFLEEEAELSESDWDSADEDEKGLDKLEFEEADDEHIDENEVKDQLGKIHMKQMLDEDKREVRMLKELLFEDGDLHTDGAGRERKFKWKNADKLGSNVEMPRLLDENDGWVDVQEDEEEAKWSKLRHERDKFLEERMKKSSNEIEDELNNSQIFKFGLKACKKIKDNESQKQDTPLDKINSTENMEPIMPQNLKDLLNSPNVGKQSQTIYNFIKRRSLLTRGEESLAKLASLAKQGESTSHMTKTRNFVFQYIEPDNTTEKKRRESTDLFEDDMNSQNKSRKRKVTSGFSQRTRKRQKQRV